MRERRDLREASRSMKEVRTWDPFSTRERNEYKIRERKSNVKMLLVKVVLVCFNCLLVLRSRLRFTRGGSVISAVLGVESRYFVF